MYLSLSSTFGIQNISMTPALHFFTLPIIALSTQTTKLTFPFSSFCACFEFKPKKLSGNVRMFDYEDAILQITWAAVGRLANGKERKGRQLVFTC